MGQMVKKKKKGRPSKADLAARRSSGSAAEKSDGELRRSGRRRNVRYAFEIDDYLDDDEYFVDEDEEEEDESRREKKLKLLLKLQNMEGSGGGGGVAESTPSPTRHVRHAPTASGSSSDFGKPSKIRKIDGDEEYEENDGGDDGDTENDGDEGRGRKPERKTISTTAEHPSGIPLPDKKTLELILNKLQKKDIYGVYAEPVDPEELPDYHDVIEHPMDFQTVKNKLGNGSYATLEQFESDVFLICSNAMQYNAPDTIYYKQARTIQELAEKKFQKLRINFERTENTKSEQKPKSSTAVKKVMKKPIGWMVQKPVGSDFFSGATLATAGDIQNGSNAFHLGGSERPSSIDRLIERNSSAVDNNMDKEESHLGKALSRFGRKAAVPDENRRATYNITSQPVTNLESIFTTFDGESKQLVPVGLYTDYSYARSLARYAATLGPNVWKVASRRIEQALPPGFKFGRGWVGECEELPTPVLMPENYTLKEPAFLAKFVHRTDAEKDKFVNPASSKENPVKGPKTEGQLPYFGSSGTKPTADNSPNISINGRNELPVSDANIGSNAFVTGNSGNKPSGSASPKYHQQNSQPQNFIKSEKKVVKHVELNSVPLANERNANFSSQSQVTKSVAVPGSRSFETVPMNINMLSSGSYKQLNINSVSAGVPDGKSPNNGFDSNGTVRQPSNDFVNSMNKAATLFANGQGQGLSDPVRRMMLSEKNPNQQKSSSQQARVDVPPVSPATVSLPKDGPNNAASAAARAWMSIGEASYKQAGENINSQNNQISPGSTHNPRDFQSQFRGELPAHGMYIQPGKGNFPFPFHAFVPHPARVGTEGQSPYEPMVFPQSVPADLSRFQMQQSSRPNLNAPAPPRQKRESVPPDLNVSFQSSGSPGRPSGVLVDSQHPDLALQL
ncbi:bromodomain-containing protein DDB_G0270170-like isoform X2 [Ipomoea triloba]|uniref:bromodomain-containing protein DDB_G0270170-like isoform X2 n=1 Tax=Ipomoea triloba TaxID=35885 RepID=UPI00125E123C|nr:bromodomain-containing protein DDB_G0270170-like isoform X2 [Ipomoea triloba]